MKFLLIALALLFALCARTQISVDKPIVFTSPADEERQILNVGTAVDANDGVSVSAYRNGAISHGMASGTNTIQIDLTPNAQNYTNGMLLSFLATASNTDTVHVNVDGLGDVLVHRPDGLPLDPSDILAGQVVILIYLNGIFIMHSRRSEACPLGAVKVNETYCIQVNESGPLNFYDAALDCHDQGGRLCKWDEHFYACQRVDLNLQDIQNNWEWIDETSDHTHTADQVNRWQCTSQRSIGAQLTELSQYRCCFTIR